MPSEAVKVYIVDSEPSVCVAYARLLRSAKMQPRIFNSVEEFMRTDVSDENSCVIAEVTMPGGRGIELPSLLARSGHCIPVIFITADNDALFRGQRVHSRATPSGSLTRYMDQSTDSMSSSGAIKNRSGGDRRGRFEKPVLVRADGS